MKNAAIKFISFFFILISTISIFIPISQAETPVVRLKRDSQKQESSQESVGNDIAVGTGQIRDGEQIPLPTYRDGKKATRQEVYYMVSPAEVPTSMTFITGQSSGTFYIKCDADQEGVVHISLWQQSGTGGGTKVVGSDTYRILKENFKREGITSAGGEEDDENVVTAQMRVLSQRLIANYMVVAIRSVKK